MKGAKPSDQRARAAAATMLQVAKIRAAQDAVAAAIAGRGIQVREIFRVLPDRENSRRHRLRRRRLHRLQGARPRRQPDGLQRPRQPRRGHGRRLRCDGRRCSVRRPLRRQSGHVLGKIGPGTAPKALLYGLRVFGCAGGTGLTTLAIDWAMDPNGDSDLSDHLDVINMSLGSNFGTVKQRNDAPGG